MSTFLKITYELVKSGELLLFQSLAVTTTFSVCDSDYHVLSLWQWLPRSQSAVIWNPQSQQIVRIQTFLKMASLNGESIVLVSTLGETGHTNTAQTFMRLPSDRPGCSCRLINSPSITLQNDLYIKSSTVNIYVYDCHINHIYIYMYQLLNNIVTCNFIILFHVVLHI